MNAPSVVECGGSLLLLNGDEDSAAQPGIRGQAQFGTWRWFVLTLAFTALPLVSTFAQSYSIDWFTVDGGGGTSTGGVYSVSGTIGQPDASQQPMTGGNYSLVGGFWSFAAVQTMGAPWLYIVPAGPGQATVFWTPATPGFALQESVSLTPPNWTNSPSGGTNPITVPLSNAMKFYRLTPP